MNEFIGPELTLDEYDKLYATIMRKLKEPFPNGTVKKKNKSDRSAHIPVQAYIKKLNYAAGGYYKWRITNEKPIIHEEEGLLEMRGLLTILGTSVEGQGSQKFYYAEGTKQIQNKDEVIKAAGRRALVHALDMFETGWLDLAPHREWGSNPGLGLRENEEEDSDNPKCHNCGQILTVDEVKLIESAQWKIYYCDKHVPEFVRKKLK
ncbi:hypothetical protein ABER99_20600 [Paenibacillus glucanolyticus]|jgi:hypothetical protein|uniref:Uncharacterized protein n=1 Tax=Paenibacillus glucanolyticus TaxID=59843 RepID=A0A168EWL4_9BACL|nr:hypothetical protein [Paenibacillus glucanolyticus]KZS44896.1 hypothetical protein AWU65_02620 [Paenibacillus glucanolyticus]OMF65556.1 hypothetical protein BK142_30565 [Paenibacillus glucanolyticus]